MKRAILLIALPLAAASHPDGFLIDRQTVPPPAFEAVKDIDGYATAAEYRAAAEDRGFVLEKLTYASDNLSVFAYLYRPAVAPKQPQPVIIFNRGSFVVRDQAPVLLVMFHRLAQAGFLIVAPMYRGSDGAPGRDEMGGADLDDLKNVLPLLKYVAGADASNVFLYGESRGAMMTFFALRDGFPARAAATFGGITDIAAYLEANPRLAAAAPSIFPGFAENRAEVLASRSSIQWPDRLNAPILLMHGGADMSVDPMQTLNLATRLQQLKKEYGLIVFAGDGHILSNNRVERDRQAVAWFRRWLK